MRWFAVALLLGALPSPAEPTTMLVDNGDPARRIDLVILGDGFTASEMDDFRAHARYGADRLFAQSPFLEYRRFFNVHAVEVVSNESGADHPEREPASWKDTALDATYNCAGIERAICVDTAKVQAVLDRSVRLAARDIVLVLVNDEQYGGTGGRFAVSSVHDAWVEVSLHEIGHSFARLADEYVDDELCPFFGLSEPRGANATRETRRTAIKWNAGGGPPTGWIEPSTPLPTVAEDDRDVGLYEGARYCAEGFYRPTFTSKMRELYQPWRAVNAEQLVKSIYGLVSPVDDVAPPPGDIVAEKFGVLLRFAAAAPRPVPDTIEIAWVLDGVVVGRTEDLELDVEQLELGDHVLRLEIADTTPRVRNDPEDLLRDSRSWTVVVEPPADDDGDGLPTSWELEHGLDPDDPDDAGQDADGDGLTNLQEFAAQTNPTRADSDGDGANDGEEVADGFNPLDAEDCPPWVCGSRLLKLLWSSGVLHNEEP